MKGKWGKAESQVQEELIFRSSCGHVATHAFGDLGENVTRWSDRTAITGSSPSSECKETEAVEFHTTVALGEKRSKC